MRGHVHFRISSLKQGSEYSHAAIFILGSFPCVQVSSHLKCIKLVSLCFSLPCNNIGVRKVLTLKLIIIRVGYIYPSLFKAKTNFGIRNSRVTTGNILYLLEEADCLFNDCFQRRIGYVPPSVSVYCAWVDAVTGHFCEREEIKQVLKNLA